MTTARGGGPAVTVGARGRDVASRGARGERRSNERGRVVRAVGGRARVEGSLAVGGNGANRGRRVIQRPRPSASRKGKRRRSRASERGGREENR